MKYIMPSSCQIANLSELYETYFGSVRIGTFVDVGAHDGITFSNTRGLAEAGWKGMCFEPLPELYEKLHSLYPDDGIVKAYDCCVGDKDGITKLYLGENPTIDIETVRKQPWGTPYSEENYILRTVVTLDQMLLEFCADSGFEVLSIDVEGAELQVLQGFDIEYWKPQMVIIETHEGNVDSRKSFHAVEINKYFSDFSYVKIQVDGLNTIYMRKDLM